MIKIPGQIESTDRGLKHPESGDNEKFTNALEQARTEILARKASEKLASQSGNPTENTESAVSQGLGSASPELISGLNSDSAGGLQKEILSRTLEILQGDKRIIENKESQPSGSAHELTEAVENGDLTEMK